MRVLIPRGGSWGDEVARLVTDAGFEPLILPLVTIEPAEDQEHLQRILAQLAEGRFDWLVVTSQSTVRVLPRVPVSVHVAAVGAVTAASLRERGVPVAFIPTKQSAAGLVDEWPIREGRVLWPHALDARPTIADGLRRHGMQVTEVVAYRTVPVFESGDALAEAVSTQTGAIPVVGADATRQQEELQAAGEDGADAVLTAVEPAETPIDAVLVTSGSVAKQVARLGLAGDTRIIAIGDQTAEDCRKHGLRVAGIAQRPNAQALVAALVAAAGR
ncbi:uroporphyrinogen-III synthase [Agrococcus sediminis]|uniref:Uroporphyrinogen-III synthase n=1 Tax=Agrococcus sediminis TaxID=2599924 RepID=A0A5M8QJD3_9MICO|nr:uroporphyrinogen-III synthase [Agrococcus sediminis]KAA6436165.1 uroporphyrinogen-III synthase [Agrococcus sediminis]